MPVRLTPASPCCPPLHPARASGPPLISCQPCATQVDFVDNMVRIMGNDDSIPTADAMQTLIRLVSETSAPLGTTEQELLRASLMATRERKLLESFSHSPALTKVVEWVAQCQQHDP